DANNHLYTRSLHDALPILEKKLSSFNRIRLILNFAFDIVSFTSDFKSIVLESHDSRNVSLRLSISTVKISLSEITRGLTFKLCRSEEHTSELQSRENLVFR